MVLLILLIDIIIEYRDTLYKNLQALNAFWRIQGILM